MPLPNVQEGNSAPLTATPTLGLAWHLISKVQRGFVTVLSAPDLGMRSQLVLGQGLLQRGHFPRALDCQPPTAPWGTSHPGVRFCGSQEVVSRKGSAEPS